MSRAQLLALALGETLAWASFFYMFPAMLLGFEAGFGWSRTTLSSAFTLALVTAALCAPVAGRVIDAGHGAILLRASTLGGAALVALMSRVETPWQFFVLWAGLGATMAGALYEPCFAYLTRLLGGNARKAITSVTLIAGFAGTVSFPFAHVMVERFGFRGALVGYALLAGLVAAPLIAFGTRARPERDAVDTSPDEASRGAASRALRSPTFWLVSLGFAMVALNHAMLVTHLLPLLDGRGVAASTAVLAAALIGPLQVAGRVAMMTVGARATATAVSLTSFASILVAALALGAAAWLPLLVFVFVLLQGAGWGVTSITRPVITAEYLGRAGFGTVSGLQASVVVGAFAAAPSLGAWLQSVGGYRFMLGTCGALALGALALLATAALRQRN